MSSWSKKCNAPVLARFCIQCSVNTHGGLCIRSYLFIFMIWQIPSYLKYICQTLTLVWKNHLKNYAISFAYASNYTAILKLHIFRGRLKGRHGPTGPTLSSWRGGASPQGYLWYAIKASKHQDRLGGRALRPHGQLYPCLTYKIHVLNW